MERPSQDIQNTIKNAIQTSEQLERQFPAFIGKMGGVISKQIHIGTRIAFTPGTSPQDVMTAKEQLEGIHHKLVELRTVINGKNPAIAKQIEAVRKGIAPILFTLDLRAENSATIVEMESPTVVTPHHEQNQSPSSPSSNGYRLESYIQSDVKGFIKILEKALEKQGLSHLQYLARGGMGMVIKAREESLDRDVVVKINMVTSDPAMVETFLKEGKRAAGIGVHPNIVTVFRTGTTEIEIQGIKEPLPYHVMEYVDGENGKAMNGKDLLKKLSANQKTLPVEAALVLSLQFAKGLMAAHENGIMHRDVKPDNVLVPMDVQKLISEWLAEKIDERSLISGLQKASGLKVSDFGLAGVRGKKVALTAKTPTNNEEQSLSGGTIGYMPPEGYDTEKPTDKSWDVYSLGIVLYQFLMGGKMPLEYSYGIRPETPKNFVNYFAKISKAKTPAIAEAEKDPNIQTLIEKNPKNEKIWELLKNMTAHEANDRCTMAETIAVLEILIDERSEKSKTLEEAKGKSTLLGKRLKQIIAIALLAGGLGLFELRRERAQFREERRRTYFALKAALEKTTGRQCLCAHLEECQNLKMKGATIDPAEIPSEKDFETILALAQNIDQQFHGH